MRNFNYHFLKNLNSMKKKVIEMFGAALLVSALIFNVSLGNAKKSAGNIDLLSLSQTAEAGCEDYNPWSASGKCLQLSQICVFAVEYKDCDPYK